MDRASICGSVQLVILLSGSRVLESLCHPQRLLVLELLCWGSRGPPSLGGMLRLSDGCEVWAFPGAAGPQIVPGKEEQGPNTQDPWGKGKAEGPGALLKVLILLPLTPQRELNAGDVGLLGTGRLVAPNICFPATKPRPESLLKGNRWTMVRAPESSDTAPYHEHNLRPMGFE